MTKNPYLNALAAAVYIVAIVLLISSFQMLGEEKDSVFIPMAMLSLVVLSAATMGYLFFFKPIQLYLDGEKREAVTLFTHTLFTFAGITTLFVLVMLIVQW